MNKFYDNLAKGIVQGMLLLALVIELPIKVISGVIFFILFVTVVIFFAPFVKNVNTPEWWDNWCSYNRTPSKFCLYNLVDRGWGYML